MTSETGEPGTTLMFQDHIPAPGRSRMRVELDKKSIMALASDTRLEILKSLQPMRRTVSQLSEELTMDKAGVHRHLKKLEDGGLVKRYEDHGFVYYGLTWKARDLLAPNENTKIIILISAFWILGLVMALFIAAVVMVENGNDSLSGLLDSRGVNEDYNTDQMDSEYASAYSMPIIQLLLLVAPMTVLAILILIRVRRPRQPRPGDSVGIDDPSGFVDKDD